MNIDWGNQEVIYRMIARINIGDILSSVLMICLLVSMIGCSGTPFGFATDAPVAGKGKERERLKQEWLKLLGDFPSTKPPLEPDRREIGRKDGIVWYHVSFQAEPDDRVTAYLLVPEKTPKPAPAVICIHGTTWGSGKERTVGLSGLRPGDPPDPPETSRAYGIELARWGYVTLSIDLLCDGERVLEGQHIYDTTEFNKRHPDWSIVGKNIWDVMRSVDFLETLDFVDPERIGCMGHSLGGHSSLFAAAFEPRITAAVCNGGMLTWARHTDHWSRPADFTERDKGPAAAYVYIPNFRVYIDDTTRPIPVDFDSLMMIVSPRPLLIMASENEIEEQRLGEKFRRAAHVYHLQGSNDRIALFSYPGEHNFPPVAKLFSVAWLDRWLDHSPSVRTLWQE